MMTMSRAISAGQALGYYQQEFTNSNYSEAGEVKSRWSGLLADEWELKGQVSSEQYESLVAGEDPRTGEQLVRSVKAREAVNEYRRDNRHQRASRRLGRNYQRAESVSLAREAHRESVNEALKGFGEYLQAHGGSEKTLPMLDNQILEQMRRLRLNGIAAFAQRLEQP